MATYNFQLVIDDAVLSHQPSDTFCIAKKVGGKFTTVFAAASIAPKTTDEKPLISQNDFQWTDRYRVGATTTYAHGMLVRSSAKEVDINFGDATTWNKSSFTPATPAAISDFTNPSGAQSHEDSFLADTIPDNLHTVVEMETSGKWAPIYVDPDTHVGTVNKQLTPLNEYLLFWDSLVTTSAMIDSSKFAYTFTFSFEAGAKSKTVRFGYAVPEKPSPGESAKFYNV